MAENFKVAISRNVKVTVAARPAEDFSVMDVSLWKEGIKKLEAIGVNLLFKANIHQKFAIMERKIVWYGSINLLSYGRAEESVM